MPTDIYNKIKVRRATHRQMFYCKKCGKRQKKDGPSVTLCISCREYSIQVGNEKRIRRYKQAKSIENRKYNCMACEKKFIRGVLSERYCSEECRRNMAAARAYIRRRKGDGSTRDETQGEA